MEPPVEAIRHLCKIAISILLEVKEPLKNPLKSIQIQD
jgi:hypothetical protein